MPAADGEALAGAALVRVGEALDLVRVGLPGAGRVADLAGPLGDGLAWLGALAGGVPPGLLADGVGEGVGPGDSGAAQAPWPLPSHSTAAASTAAPRTRIVFSCLSGFTGGNDPEATENAPRPHSLRRPGVPLGSD
ncbi:MAG: hypothetical protein Q4G45_03220 [Actinomycetia bacterium]|nr:hypothetical protein [Actinomycetes bacterium]